MGVRLFLGKRADNYVVRLRKIIFLSLTYPPTLRKSTIVTFGSATKKAGPSQDPAFSVRHVKRV